MNADMLKGKLLNCIVFIFNYSLNVLKIAFLHPLLIVTHAVNEHGNENGVAKQTLHFNRFQTRRKRDVLSRYLH